jgi:uncharacterized membrane protein
MSTLLIVARVLHTGRLTYVFLVYRWNSWDVVRDPMGILTDVAFTLRHPLANAHALAYCGVLVAFLLTAYLVVVSWAVAHERPEHSRP